MISWAIFIAKGQQNFGVDFTGGSSITFTFDEKQSVEDIRATLEKAGIKNPSIQYQEDKINDVNLLAVTVKNAVAGDVAHDAITSAYSDYEEQSRGTVSQVGKELKSKGTMAIILAMLGIVAYVTVRFEFAFAMQRLSRLFTTF